MKEITGDSHLSITFLQGNDEDALITPFLINADSCEKAFSALTEEEQLERKDCEKTINEGLLEFTGVGIALFTIKSKKLYRSTHHSFEEYCKAVFGITRVHANRLIEHHKTIEELKTEPTGSVCIPAKETHSRELAGCTSREKREVAKACKQLVGNKTPTASDWKNAVEETRAKRDSRPIKVTKGKTETNQTNKPANHIPFANNLAPTTLPSFRELFEMARDLGSESIPQAKKRELETLTVALGKYAEWQEMIINQPAEAA